MRSKLISGIVALAFIIFISACTSSRKTIAIEEGWDLIGEKTVNFVKDKDIIDVTTSNTYTDIKFQVEKKDIIIKDLNVVYQNGDKLAPAIPDMITAGEMSKIIHLSPGGKSIRTIEIKYRSKGSILKGRAKILVFGKRYMPVQY
ncbi:MAG: hypothetical protein ABIP68_05605 [Ferruginibacter sp.]